MKLMKRHRGGKNEDFAKIIPEKISGNDSGGSNTSEHCYDGFSQPGLLDVIPGTGE